MPRPRLLRVRSTIRLPGLRRGNVVLVDPHDPYMAAALRRGFLTPERRLGDGGP